jgi:transposase InsO family protein
MGIRDRPISARSPWQNGHAERLVGSIRRECLDCVVVFGEGHLRTLLRSYQQYCALCRARVAEELQRRRGTRIGEHLKLVLSIIDRGER